MTDCGVTTSVYNTRIGALRFFFGMTCGKEEMKQFMQFKTFPRKLPVALGVEKASRVLVSAPGLRLMYRTARSIFYDAGLRAAEICIREIADIDSDQMLIHVEQRKGGKDRVVMVTSGLLDLQRKQWRKALASGGF